MEALCSFWTWVYIIAIGAFYILVLAVIPLGFRDLVILFKHLNKDVKTKNSDDASS